jgi:hypothetical protein
MPTYILPRTQARHALCGPKLSQLQIDLDGARVGRIHVISSFIGAWAEQASNPRMRRRFARRLAPEQIRPNAPSALHALFALIAERTLNVREAVGDVPGMRLCAKSMRVHVCMRACLCMRVRVCVCVRACLCMCVHMLKHTFYRLSCAICVRLFST